ncbi:MYG1 family protein [Roseomonas sp. USHLN139]|uniref:MYG1 family protein n=1 Tax=Roseomonas sp. USHLN139 TaxID=3081298 RepID=UPI003B023E72
MTDKPLPLLVTHSGGFHCDEAFAYAVLKRALGLGPVGTDHRLLRTRDMKRIAEGDIVFDVGLEYDAARNRFDHHQRGAPTRADGTPFSAAGLVWQKYGEAAVRAILPEGAKGFAAAIAQEIDRGVVFRIDEIDNGTATSRGVLDLASLIGDCNLAWDAPGGDDPAAEDAAFQEAAALADAVLARRVDAVRGRHVASAEVLAAHGRGADARVLVLDRRMPWKGAVFDHALPVIYCVYPVQNGNWMVDTMPPEPKSFEQRLPLPEGWAGLQDAALAEASGVPDAVFVHLRRFVGAARSRDGALAMAQKALSLGFAAATTPKG